MTFTKKGNQSFRFEKEEKRKARSMAEIFADLDDESDPLKSNNPAPPLRVLINDGNDGINSKGW